MAWTTLTFAFGSLLTSTKMTQLQDNLTAVAQGLSGAPALIVAPVNLTSQTAGDYLMHSNDADRTTTSATYVKIKESKIAKAGAYRIKFDLRETTLSGSVLGRIYQNGVAVGTERTTSADTTYSEDIAGFVAGDLIQIYARINTGAQAGVRNFRVYGNAPGDFGSLLNY